ncbi:hypothetical protein LTR37_004653 [Vermiconidia calcicola]|uniref:Uncharacterized protein n=1 Tax=Vermiconidia calcicola TaxID=1690605 RepID=A0ACC3NN82_9PEZI|nr:hypothetical protein LTR37_004653 [Vermiconidia calcicola]
MASMELQSCTITELQDLIRNNVETLHTAVKGVISSTGGIVVNVINTGTQYVALVTLGTGDPFVQGTGCATVEDALRTLFDTTCEALHMERPRMLDPAADDVTETGNGGCYASGSRDRDRMEDGPPLFEEAIAAVEVEEHGRRWLR